MDQQNATRAAADDAAAMRRKSLGRLGDMSVTWDADPQGNRKYSRNDDMEPCCPSSVVASGGGRESNETRRSLTDGMVSVDLTSKQQPSMSTMEMESIKERERTSMLRKCAQHLELESVNGKYTRENFKRGILNKVGAPYFSVLIERQGFSA
jgi:hypothetical protein